MSKEFDEWVSGLGFDLSSTELTIAVNAFEAGRKSRPDPIKIIQIARDVFRSYQAHHEYKGEEMLAAVNRNYAEQMEAAFKQAEHQDDQ